MCGDQGPLLLKARCHLTAPLSVTLDGDELIVRCYLPTCGREVARFRIVRTPPPANLAELRAEVARGAGHDCEEWWMEGRCVLCDRER